MRKAQISEHLRALELREKLPDLLDDDDMHAYVVGSWTQRFLRYNEVLEKRPNDKCCSKYTIQNRRVWATRQARLRFIACCSGTLHCIDRARVGVSPMEVETGADVSGVT